MQVSKWGNSLAIRLPASVVNALELKEGDDIEVLIEGERAMRVTRAPSRSDLAARLSKFQGKLPAGFKFSRDDANARG
ncbi:MAG: AbrB/MazE/SpoVT family DNA-binding domain-containing protein [Betaproteobacteria bacterium]|nr:AbrB/MazE/SpoVT family DNA-binding domain-containing protein [Betaproteobacteria bacterium]